MDFVLRHRGWLQLGMAAAVLLAPQMGMAQVGDSQILDDATSLVQSVWETFRTIIYILAAFGLAVLAIMAFFGRFKWSHFLALAGGVFLIASADALISFLGGDSSGLMN